MNYEILKFLFSCYFVIIELKKINWLRIKSELESTKLKSETKLYKYQLKKDAYIEELKIKTSPASVATQELNEIYTQKIHNSIQEVELLSLTSSTINVYLLSSRL